MIAALAVAKAGAAYVPLDPATPPARLRVIVEDSAARIVVSAGPLKALAVSAASGRPVIDLADETSWQSAAHDSLGLRAAGPAQLAYVIYTSGSTGRPKGVMVSHQNIVRLVRNTTYVRFRPGQRIGHAANVAFDASTFELWGALLNGGCVVVIEPSVGLSPQQLGRECQRLQVSTLFVTTALFQACAREAPGTFRGISELLFGGERCQPGVVREALANEAPEALIHVYGPTETTTFATAGQLALETVSADAAVPIGRPIANTRAYILDGRGEPVPVGVVGELYIGGPGVARGYIGDPSHTASRFVADPYSVPGARIYRTGDLARWRNDGAIEFVGRADFQVKLRGFRIELGEIEARLMDHVGVGAAVVIASDTDAGEQRLVAYYTVPTDSIEVRPETLREHLRETLPDYMLPAAYMRLDTWPLTPNGKIDRAALPSPESQAFVSREYAPPIGAVETALASIWTEVLTVERVGRYDDFFALGGHSLSAVRVITRLRQALGVDVAIADLFARPVLADLAVAVAQARRSTLPALAAQVRGARIPLSFAQQRLWVLAQMGVSSPYHVPWTIQLTGRLDRIALRRALDRIVARHETLRTTFAVADGVPLQRIAPATESRFLLREEDLRETQDMPTVLAEEFLEPFDLETGPLIRGVLLTIGDEAHILAIHDASHRHRRLVDERVPAGAAHALRRVRAWRRRSVAGAAVAVCRLCDLAACLADRRSARRTHDVLDQDPG